jgi:membrane protein implicated in regulation of membrane protease activity
MSIEALQIVASSWPFAIVTVSLIAGITIFAIIRQFRTWDREDKGYRASQARDVTTYREG